MTKFREPETGGLDGEVSLPLLGLAMVVMMLLGGLVWAYLADERCRDRALRAGRHTLCSAEHVRALDWFGDECSCGR